MACRNNNPFLILILLFMPFFAFASENPLAQADKFYAMEKYKEALEMYEKIKATYPGTDWAAMSYLMSARSYEKTGKTDSALEQYRAIIAKFGKSRIAEEAYFAVARLRAAKGRPKDAIKAYQLYNAAYPMGQYRVMALFNMASLYKEKGNSAAALAKYGELLKNFPNETWFYSWSAIYCGHIMYMKKDYNQAIEYYQMVINTENNKFLYTLASLHRGQAYIEKKDYKTAVSIFEKLLKKSTYFAEEALYGLGKAHYKANEFEMAKESLETLLQLFPETVWKGDVQKKIKTIEKRIKAEGKKDL